MGRNSITVNIFFLWHAARITAKSVHVSDLFYLNTFAYFRCPSSCQVSLSISTSLSVSVSVFMSAPVSTKFIFMMYLRKSYQNAVTCDPWSAHLNIPFKEVCHNIIFSWIELSLKCVLSSGISGKSLTQSSSSLPSRSVDFFLEKHLQISSIRTVV